MMAEGGVGGLGSTPVNITSGAANSTSSLWGALGPGLAAGGIGYMAGGFIRPDNPTASYVGAGAGLLAGGIAGMAGLGALAATGVGALVAIPAALIAGLATPRTETHQWTTPAGSKPALTMVDDQVLPMSYGVVKTTSSGMFGDSSTRHSTMFYAANPEIAAQVTSASAAASAGLTRFAGRMGYDDASYKDVMKGLSFPFMAVPDGYEDVAYRNMAEWQTQHFLQTTGLESQVTEVHRAGEAYIDTLSRITSALDVFGGIAVATGYRIEDLAQGMTEIQRGDYASKLIEAAGGTDALTAALTRVGKYGYSTSEQLQRSTKAMAEATGRSRAPLDDATITTDNFWERFRGELDAGMDPERIALWVQASAVMEQWETTTRSALDSVQEAIDSMRDSLRMDPALSPQSPAEILAEYRANYDELVAAVRGGDLSKTGALESSMRSYLQQALGYHGATDAYAAIWAEVETTINSLTSPLLETARATATAAQAAALAATPVSVPQPEIVGDPWADLMAQIAAALAQQQGVDISATTWGGGGVQYYADGGLVMGGVPGVDSVPAMLMPGERVLTYDQSRLIERIATLASPTDTARVESLLSTLIGVVADGNQGSERRLSSLEARVATLASAIERRVQ